MEQAQNNDDAIIVSRVLIELYTTGRALRSAGHLVNVQPGTAAEQSTKIEFLFNRSIVKV